MYDKNKKKVISISLAITLTALFGLALANTNYITLSYGQQQTSGQIIKGTITQGIIKAANLTNGQIQNNSVNNGDLVGANVTGATIINADLNTVNNSSTSLQYGNSSSVIQLGAGKINSALIISGIMTKGQVNGGYVSQGKMTGAKITGADIQGAVLKNVNINEVLVKVGNNPNKGILNKVPVIGNFLQKIDPFK